MKAFAFDRQLIDGWSQVLRSFSTIGAGNLRDVIEGQHAEGQFWPGAFLWIDPRHIHARPDHRRSGGVGHAGPWRGVDLPVRGDADSAPWPSGASHRQGAGRAGLRGDHGHRIGRVAVFFRAERRCDPVGEAGRRPALHRGDRRLSDEPAGRQPVGEIEKLIAPSGLPADLQPAVWRYTGNETQAEREPIAANPPDILLANSIMAAHRGADAGVNGRCRARRAAGRSSAPVGPRSFQIAG